MEMNPVFQSIINLASFGVNDGPSDFAYTGISRAHEALMTLRDGWANICSVPSRGRDEDECVLHFKFPVIAKDGTKSIKDKEEDSMAVIFDTIWKFLLLSACSSDQIEDDLINRIIKDGSDYGIEILSFEELQTLLETEVYKSGFDRLKAIYEKSIWKELTSNKKDHKTKRVADSRFETPFLSRKKNKGSGKGRDKEDHFMFIV